MRIALLADIHGNELALNAVLRDIEARGGVNAYWILGDLVALGPQPVRVLETLSELPYTRCSRQHRPICRVWRPAIPEHRGSQK